MLEAWDKAAFLALNSLHAPWLDGFMYQASSTGVWIPFFLVLLYLLWRAYGKAMLWIIVILPLLILLCDQTASGLFKPLVKRLRPCNDPEIGHLVHIVNGYCAQSYGFFSSHASNSFGLATYLAFFFRGKSTLGLWSGFVWAVLHSYTRIYLGVHYPGDIMAGAGVGVLYGWGCALLAQKLIRC